MKKRILSIVMALLIALSVTVCGSSVAEEAPKFKIGYSYWSNVDVLGKQFYDNIKATVEGLGCEFMYLDWPSIDTEGIQEATQNLIEAGCDGIIAISVLPAMIDMCNRSGVKLMQLCSALADESMIAQAQTGDAYVGSVTVDDYQAGYEMAQSLADAGCKNIAYVTQAAGSSSALDDRVRGVEAYVADHPNVTLITNYRGGQMTDGVRQMMTAFPEIDGLVVVGNDGTVIGAIYADGMQNQVKIATVDLQDGNDEQINDGVIVWLADGQAPMANLSVALLYNALAGTPLVTGDERVNPILGTYVYIKSIEDYQDFVALYQGGEQVFNVDEVKSLIKFYNPDVTLEDFVKMAGENSLESVKLRHGIN